MRRIILAAIDLLNSTDFQVEDLSHLDRTTIDAASELQEALLLEGAIITHLFRPEQQELTENDRKSFGLVTSRLAMFQSIPPMVEELHEPEVSKSL